METVNEGTNAMRHGALALAGAAAFGVAAAAGSGVHAMAQGAWAGPALFAGGAALSLPPLYMLGALGGGGEPASEVAEKVIASAGRVGIALLGLAAPAAFFSTTMGGDLARALLLLACATIGVCGIIAVARRGGGTTTAGGLLATIAWPLFAIALGGRLMFAIAKHVGFFGGS
jgi:hypothetical protein